MTGFVVPPHTPYQWQDLPSEATPLDAANLATAETDLVNYTQTVIGAYDTFAKARFLSGTQNAKGTLGTNFTVDLQSTPNDTVMVTGILDANCTVALINRAAGDQVTLLFAQNTMGNHTLTISDGFNTQPVQIPSGASAAFFIVIECPNANDIYILN